MAVSPLTVSMTVKVEQRGHFPRVTWPETRLPRLHFYACAMRVDGKFVTPWFARLSITWGRSEFWFYLWPWTWPWVEGVSTVRRFGRRRLVMNPAWAEGLGRVAPFQDRRESEVG